MAAGARMTAIRIVIPGVAVAKGRPRFTRAGRVYTPATTAKYAKRVAAAAVDAMAGAPPIAGPVEMIMHVLLPIPASWAKAKRASAAQGSVRPVGKPDADNFAKNIMDACNGILWLDDAQVVDLRCVKYYSACPLVTVEVSAV
jgi:Holliday junction resolvase RusA-like endonuclease